MVDLGDLDFLCGDFRLNLLLYQDIKIFCILLELLVKVFLKAQMGFLKLLNSLHEYFSIYRQHAICFLKRVYWV